MIRIVKCKVMAEVRIYRAIRVTDRQTELGTVRNVGREMDIKR
jgi:hypothetical protein